MSTTRQRPFGVTLLAILAAISALGALWQNPAVPAHHPLHHRRAAVLRLRPPRGHPVGGDGVDLGLGRTQSVEPAP